GPRAGEKQRGEEAGHVDQHSLALKQRLGSGRTPDRREQAPRREGQERESSGLLDPAESRLAAQDKCKRAGDGEDERAPAPGRRPIAAAVRAKHEDDCEREQGWSSLREREPSEQAA